MEAVIVCIGSDGARAIAEILEYEFVEVVEAETEEMRLAFESELKAAELIAYEEFWEKVEEEEKVEYPPHYIKRMKSQVLSRKPKYIRARSTC